MAEEREGASATSGTAALASAAWAGPLLDAVRGVRWVARRRVMPAIVGAHRSRRLGAAVEFSEYRAYRPGDETRRIDWKLLARSDRAYVRLTEDHALLPTTVIVDASASMAYPTPNYDKWMLARGLAVGLVAVAHASGDPVGVTVVSGDQVIADLPLTTRRGTVATVAGVLGGIAPGSSAPIGARRPIEAIGTRGRVVFIGDFLQRSEEALSRARGVMASGGEVYAVHVVAEEELHPPTLTLLVSDPEDETFRRPLIAETRRAYQEAYGAWREELRWAWQGAGATHAMVSTQEPGARAVRRIVRL